MTDLSLPLDAYVVIDNNAIVGLCDFHCDRHKELPFQDMIKNACTDIASAFDGLRRFALDDRIFTTACVHEEFKPENSDLSKRRDYDKIHCEALKTAVKGQVEPLDINMEAIQRLRKMSGAPKKLGDELSRLSDPDLSLVILALGIINEKKKRVYVLTDEEDLRLFISWAKTKPEIKEICPSSQLLEGLHSMIYMDSAHRHCAFATVQIYEMFAHYQQSQLKRMALAGTTKFGMIEVTYQQIKEAIRASGKIKQENLAGAA